MLKCGIHRPLGDLIEHHAISRLSWPFRNYLFGKMLADCFAFAVGVSGEINSISLFRGLLELRDDLLVISLPGVGNYLVGRLEIMLDVDTQTLRRQILDVAYRCFDQVIITQIFVDCLCLCRRFNYDQILRHIVWCGW